MNLIDSKAELLEQKYDLQGVYEQIELSGRTSYKSEGRITLDDKGRSTTAEKFTKMLQNAGHGAALEHGTVYLTINDNERGASQACGFYLGNPYSFLRVENNTFYITTNYRVITECGRESDLKWLSTPTEYHQKRYTIRFTLSRAIANEFVRHRVFSFLQESTRYVNYKDGLTIIKPSTYDEWPLQIQSIFDSSMNSAESGYQEMIEQGAKPEQARDILPLAMKTELVMTGTESQWEGFFKLRCDRHAHIDAQKLAKEAKKLINDKD